MSYETLQELKLGFTHHHIMLPCCRVRKFTSKEWAFVWQQQEQQEQATDQSIDQQQTKNKDDTGQDRTLPKIYLSLSYTIVRYSILVLQQQKQKNRNSPILLYHHKLQLFCSQSTISQLQQILVLIEQPIMIPQYCYTIPHNGYASEITSTTFGALHLSNIHFSFEFLQQLTYRKSLNKILLGV